MRNIVINCQSCIYKRIQGAPQIFKFPTDNITRENYIKLHNFTTILFEQNMYIKNILKKIVQAEKYRGKRN